MIYRALFAISAYLNLKVEQWDIKSAFSNASLKKDIYIIQFIDFENKIEKICKLNKALYV